MVKGFSDRPHESMVYQENNPTQQNYPPPTYEQTIPRPTTYQTQSVPDDDEENKPIENDRFYQYKIYNYCEIPSEIAETLLSQDLDQDRLVELGLLDESKKRSDRPEKNKAEELGFEESYTTSSDNTRELNTTIDKESILTDICRRDLLKPVVDMVNRNLLPLEPRKMVTIYGNVFFVHI